MQFLARRGVLFFSALALVFNAISAQAQGVFGAAEVDDDELLLLLIGASISAGGLGWKPYAAVTAYHLQFPAGTGTLSRDVVVPAVGLTNRMNDGSISFGVGYAFAERDATDPLLVGAESGKGVVGSAQWNHWGTGNHMLQVLGSYNFGTQFLWTRGRAAKPLTDTSPLWVGGELALMGGGDSDAYLAQFGPMVEWRFNPKFRLTGSAGLKAGVSNVDGSAIYGRVEFLWLPRAR
jgi:hypothetical protein